MRAAVVLFVESDAPNADERDLAQLVSIALWQNGIKQTALKATVNGVEHEIKVRTVMEAGMAMGNGYIWAGVTSKAFPSREDQ